jgi:hypothetical protein
LRRTLFFGICPPQPFDNVSNDRLKGRRLETIRILSVCDLDSGELLVVRQVSPAECIMHPQEVGERVGFDHAMPLWF